MSLAQGINTPTRPRIEPGSPDLESEALTTRPVLPNYVQYMSLCIFHFFFVKFILFALILLCVT